MALLANSTDIIEIEKFTGLRYYLVSFDYLGGRGED